MLAPFLPFADYFNGLAIFFDAYPNSQHSYQFPRVTAMMGDGKKSYDHATDGAQHEIAACSVSPSHSLGHATQPNRALAVPFDLHSHFCRPRRFQANIRKTEVASKARLTYIKDQYLQLELHYKAWDEWTSCFKINTTMPMAPYLGFSALTGQVSDAHEFVAVSSRSRVWLDPNATTG